MKESLKIVDAVIVTDMEGRFVECQPCSLTEALMFANSEVINHFGIGHIGEEAEFDVINHIVGDEIIVGLIAASDYDMMPVFTPYLRVKHFRKFTP